MIIQNNDIRNTILYGNYPSKLKPFAIKLLNYTDINNLMFCYKNLETVTIKKIWHFISREFIYDTNTIYKISGQYDSIDNSITYLRKKSLAH